ncbi:MAG: diguanylate cyclase [Desulfovibrionaceae bacterium]|nr:diguanylate cyclase [Desulfovibrionaceae bacterium]MBF0513769.1 diguanylate cyclase [Desulfovibrionaceae bacterium]
MKRHPFVALQNTFKRWVNPAMWGLHIRFLAISGIFLFFGITAAMVYISRVLQDNVDQSVQDKIRVFQQSIHDIMRTQTDSLLSMSSFVASLPEVASAIDARDRDALKRFILPLVEKVRVTTSSPTVYFHFHLPPAISFLRTWNVNKFGEDLSGQRQMVVRCNRDQVSLWGFEIGQGGTVIRAISPIFSDGKPLGSVEAAINISDILDKMQIPQDYGIALLLDNAYRDKWESNFEMQDLGKWIMLKALGNTDYQLARQIVDTGGGFGRTGNVYFAQFPLEDFQGNQIGEYLVTYNAGLILAANQAKTNNFVWLNITGSIFMWAFLALNVNRIKRFFDRLRKIIIASQQNDFSDRFESDHIHCLSVLNCANEKCPVHADPSQVCYLETGSEAISPALRNTCVFLKKYDSCDICPVYAMRCGDEIMDMKNVINTMLGTWGVFLNRVGSLLTEVLRTHDQAYRLPSLDQVSGYLEHMAKLTAFSHDLQGVNSIEEVYSHLAHAFETHFNLKHFWIMELVQDKKNMEIVMERLAYDAAFQPEVIADSSLCRARRTAEEVISEPNPVLCPYFNCDTDAYVRFCLPMVMGGRVGAIVSFVMPRGEWLSNRAHMVMLRKYLDESAPVLSSLRLLRISQEQSLRDPLTGCHNRRYLDEYLPQYETLNKRTRRHVGLLMCDVDFFKQVNDQHGHEAGDAVLKQVAEAIRDNIRASDIFIRYGGEEFLVLLNEVTAGASTEIAEKIRMSINAHAFRLENNAVLHKTISIGVAEFPDDGETMYKVIKFADVALYAAKGQGRNKVVRFTPDMWLEKQY